MFSERALKKPRYPVNINRWVNQSNVWTKVARKNISNRGSPIRIQNDSIRFDRRWYEVIVLPNVNIEQNVITRRYEIPHLLLQASRLGLI